MSFMEYFTTQIGRTALHVACEGGHCSTAALLVSRGASKEARDNSGRTPLHIAAVHRHTELVRILLENDCQVDATDDVSTSSILMLVAVLVLCKKRSYKVVEIF